MSQENHPVWDAIARWERSSLISPDLADRLREDVEASSEAGTARLTQYVLAATGAIILLIAGGLFLDWAWPRMTGEARVGLLAVLGIAVHLGGASLEARSRWLPAALLSQTAGLGLLISAALYSVQLWDQGTVGGTVVGISAIALPALLALPSLRRGSVMPAIHLCFFLGFLALALDRLTTLNEEEIVWAIDGVLVVAAAGLAVLLARDPRGERHPWALNAFVAALYAGAVLVFTTGVGPLDLGEDAVYPLDAWLLLVVALTLWGIHRAPRGLRRGWFETQLAYAVALWVPLGLYTVAEAMQAPSEWALVLVGGVGIAGFAYAVRYRVRRVLGTGALTFVAAVWYWGVDRAGALGAVLALGFTAALLFWISGRAGGWMRPSGDA